MIIALTHVRNILVSKDITIAGSVVYLHGLVNKAPALSKRVQIRWSYARTEIDRRRRWRCFSEAARSWINKIIENYMGKITKSEINLNLYVNVFAY